MTTPPVPDSIAELIPNALKPRTIDSSVQYHRDRYLVKTSAGWECYFAKSVPVPRKADPNRKYLKFEKNPPIYMAGFFAFRSKFYPVGIRDLVRGQINVRKNYALTADQLESLFTTQPVGEPAEQPGPVEPSGNENLDLDVAGNEYLRTLLFLEDPEEEWEVSEDL